MKPLYTIGIDIGGTNTDAVLINAQDKIVAAVKTITTNDITSGFSQALKSLLAQAAIEASAIRALFLGTTHATNAILQQKDLYQVGLIRLAGHHPQSLPPCFDWKEDLKQTLNIRHITISGGYECHGASITPFSLEEVRQAVTTLLAKGIESLAVVGVFAPQNREQELEVKRIALEIAGKDFPVSLSHEIGGVGFIERENSTILNAALKKVMAQGFYALEVACRQLQLNCPFFITQNNGTILDLARALEYPVLTISAGPTNSFIGASRLTGLSDALIVDIGGTSTDIGLIKQGFPRRSLNTSHIGGVKLNFSMPDVLSIALGGGSYLDLSHETPRILPKSAGKDIVTHARCFGGQFLTFTDAAVALGLSIPGATSEGLGCSFFEAQKIIQEALKKMEREIKVLEGGKCTLPIVFVGGGAQLFPREFLEERILVPEHANVANAYGAALSEISHVIDQVVSLNQRDTILQRMQEEALQGAVRCGANPKNVKIVDMQIIPYHYVPNQMARVIITAAGKQMPFYI